MKTILSFCLIMFGLCSFAQQVYNFDNQDLTIPDWLTDPAYISDNSTETMELTVGNELLDEIHGFKIVRFYLEESEFNHGETTVYLATFDKKNRITDIIYIASHTTWDWAWTEEAFFELVSDDIFRYFYVDVAYRPAENEEEHQQGGGMILSSKDSSITFYKIMKDGSIHSADEPSLLDETEDEENMEEVEEFDEEARISEIREIFTKINKNASNYRKKMNNDEKQTSLSFYYDGEELKKILVLRQVDKSTEEFYFDKGELVFVFSMNKAKKEENRYYFNKQNLFRWLKGASKTKVDPLSTEFKAKEIDMVSRAEFYSEK
jgi:hypothetical protein